MEGEDDNFKSVLWQKNMNTTVRQVVIILEASKYLQHKILEHLCYGISNINLEFRIKKFMYNFIRLYFQRIINGSKLTLSTEFFVSISSNYHPTTKIAQYRFR